MAEKPADLTAFACAEYSARSVKAEKPFVLPGGSAPRGKP